jgi:preprotein translocase subunit YajC
MRLTSLCSLPFFVTFLFLIFQREQTENKKLLKRIEEMEKSVRSMEEKFE